MRLISCSTFLFCGIAAAAPQLQLSTAAVGPVYVATGQNGPTQTVSVSNIGSGTLSFSALSNVPWLATLVSTSSLQIALNTSSLARGSYTGIITVTAPGAIDSPQTITVTVQVGSAVPDSLDLYLPPGGSATSNFNTGSIISTSVTNFTGGPTLAVSTPGAGSFAFSFPYIVTANAPVGTSPNDYTGSFTVSGSSSAADNKTVPVTAHVTTQPIAAASAANVLFRIAQSAAPQTKFVGFSNLGVGTLALSSATVTGPNTSWLTTTIQGNLVSLKADPSGLSPGAHTATVSVASNARNGPWSIPVELDVLTSGPPITMYQGVVVNALFTHDPLAPGGIAALFGEQLTTGPDAPALTVPLGTTLGGAQVLVNNQPAPLYFVSAGQINFQIPYATPAGQATVSVTRDGVPGNTVSITVVPSAPRLLRLGIDDYPIAVFPDNVTFPIPPTPGIPSRPAKAGVDVIVFYALNLGQTSPPASDGQAATATQVSPLPQVVFGQTLLPNTGVSVTPAYAGLTPGSVGLYQINVLVPSGSPRGDAVPVYIDMGGPGIVSNRVNIAVQ